MGGFCKSCVLGVALQCCDKGCAVAGSSEEDLLKAGDRGQCLPVLTQGQSCCALLAVHAQYPRTWGQQCPLNSSFSLFEMDI